MSFFMLPADPVSYDDLVSRFRWDIPERFNIGVACADRHAPEKPAIIDWSGNRPVTLSFGELSEKSNRFAAALADVHAAQIFDGGVFNAACETGEQTAMR